MIIVLTCVLAIAVVVFILGVRPKDIPVPEPESPFRHLDERKAAIYENLRDLQFEYRLGKLSDADYQSTKKDLQKDLAVVLAEVDKIKLQLNGAGQTGPKSESRSKPDQRSRDRKGAEAFGDGKEAEAVVCDACGARFDKPLKFCGECGKPMKVTK